MDQKSNLIKEDIDETRSQLTEKLVTLEEELRGTVETAKTTVEDTIENVKENLRRFTPSYQVEERPLLCLGGAVVAGVLAGRALGATPAVASQSWTGGGELRSHYPESEIPATSQYEDVSSSETAFHASPRAVYGQSRSQALPGLWKKFQETFTDEIEMVKQMATGALLSSLRDLAKRTVPNLGPHIDQVMDSAMGKFGVTPDNLASQQEGKESDNAWQKTASSHQEEDRSSKAI